MIEKRSHTTLFFGRHCLHLPVDTSACFTSRWPDFEQRYIEGVSGPRHAEGRLFGCANSATTHAILPDGWGYAPVARFERTRQVMSKGREGGEKEGREADGRRVGRGGK